MAHGCKIMLPNGTSKMVFFSEGQDRTEVLENVILSNWEDYCIGNWANAGRNDFNSPEKRIKWMLDGCANFLLYAQGGDELSAHKEKVAANKELPTNIIDKLKISSIESMFKDMDSEDRQSPSPKRRGRKSARPSELKRHKNAIVCPVDIDGYFLVGRKPFKISENVKPYQKIDTKHGEYYPMDRIIVSIGDEILFYDMQNNLIPSDEITEEVNGQ